MAGSSWAPILPQKTISGLGSLDRARPFLYPCKKSEGLLCRAVVRQSGTQRTLCGQQPSGSLWPLCLQVAIIAGNFELAEIIKTHKESDVGKCVTFGLL